MEAVIPLLIYYLYEFCPAVFGSYSSFPFPFLLYAFFVLREKERYALFCLLLILSVSLFSSELSKKEEWRSYSTIMEAEFVYGEVLSEPKRKSGRCIGYTLALKASKDREDVWATSMGYVYVISKNGDEGKGDSVLLKGGMKDTYFLASSSSVRERNSYGRGRRRFLSLFLRSLERGENGNLTALLLTGGTLDGSTELQDDVRSMGLSHLFALSGMHLTFLALIIGKPLKRLLGEKSGEIITDLLLFLFLYVTGFGSSLFRAFIFMLLMHFFELKLSFALSFPLLILLSPHSAVDLASELSFTALGGILLFCRKGDKNGIVSASMAALAVSAPISLRYFGAWSPSSVLLSIPGAIGIEILFFIIIFQYFIPKSEYLIGIFIKIIHELPSLSLIPMQQSLRYYWILLSLLFFKAALEWLYTLFLCPQGRLRLKYVESELRQSKRNR